MSKSIKKYLAWDIEIVKELPEEGDWTEHRPLGISCAATQRYHSAEDTQMEPKVWYAGQYTPDFFGGKEIGIPEKRAMNRDELREMLDYMVGMMDRGYSILTWNGLKFDFDILGEEADMPNLCASMAMNHVDMMYQFFCVKGFPCALAKAAEGLGLSGKTEGMTGAKAPELWAGSIEDRYQVLRYVAGDVEATLAVANAVEKTGLFKWITGKGQLRSARIGNWLSVKECNTSLPTPNNSWMDTPMLREDFTAWMPGTL